MFSKFLLKSSPVGSISKAVASELKRMDTVHYPPFPGGTRDKFDATLHILQIAIPSLYKVTFYERINDNPLLFALFLITFQFKNTPNSLLNQIDNVRQIIIENFTKYYGEYKEKGCLQPIHELDFKDYHCRSYVLSWLNGDF